MIVRVILQALLLGNCLKVPTWACALRSSPMYPAHWKLYAKVQDRGSVSRPDFSRVRVKLLSPNVLYCNLESKEMGWF